MGSRQARRRARRIRVRHQPSRASQTRPGRARKRPMAGRRAHAPVDRRTTFGVSSGLRGLENPPTHRSGRQNGVLALSPAPPRSPPAAAGHQEFRVSDDRGHSAVHLSLDRSLCGDPGSRSDLVSFADRRPTDDLPCCGGPYRTDVPLPPSSLLRLQNAIGWGEENESFALGRNDPRTR